MIITNLNSIIADSKTKYTVFQSYNLTSDIQRIFNIINNKEVK